MTHPTRILRFAARLAILVLVGCSANHPPDPKPEFDPGEGAISGKLVDSYSDPFDVSQAGDAGAKALQIELMSPSRGIAAATFPDKDKSTFVFSHIKPGRYELEVYSIVAGKRTIAGSLQVTVNPEQVTQASLPLTVTPLKSDSQ
jgi:hypothetical protein